MDAAIDGQVGDIEYLAIDVCVQRAGEKFAEISNVDVSGREDRFVEVGSCARVVVVLCGNRGNVGMGCGQKAATQQSQYQGREDGTNSNVVRTWQTCSELHFS